MSKKKASRRAPINTTEEVKKNPDIFLAEGLIMGAGGAVEHQEAQGQKSFVNSTTLPTEIGRFSDYDAKAVLEAAGVKFGEVVEGDSLFQYAELPAGWEKLPTDHSMWSKLVDDKGRERAMIFYKAAFYDRSAHMSLTKRFNYGKDYDRQDKEKVIVMKITDCGKVIHETKPLSMGEDREEIRKAEGKATELALAWLEKNYPDWQNPGAYWD